MEYIIQFGVYKYNSGFCPSLSGLTLPASSLPKSFFYSFQALYFLHICLAEQCTYRF